ncbi:acyltransferase [Streptomyces sp. NPDC006649]|uniref:acyltransferase family protein n=1 Tax=Streptomyces sp. NPDC006649 TaxID=3156896 RepID=UPI0033A7F1C9
MTPTSPRLSLSPAPAAPHAHSLPSLTGLRFAAAALVFGYHASLTFLPMNPFADGGLADGFATLFSKAGWMGVSFFFVLSGFVLTWSADPRDTVTGFWRRRLLKIFPNHVVTWALALALFAGALSPLPVWLPNLFLVHSWFPEPTVYLGVNSPAWSLCSELLFYLLFPLLIRLVLRLRTAGLWAWAAGMVAAMVAVQLVTDLLVPDSPASFGAPVSTWQFWIGYNFPPVRMFEFVLGMLLARLVLAGRFPRVPLSAAALLAAAGYALALWVPWLYGLNVATIVPVGVLICAVAVSDVRGMPSVLRGRAAQWLGEVSFAFYMVHYIVLTYARTELMGGHRYGPAAGMAVLLTLFLASLLAGGLLMVCVERPVMRRWAGPKARVAAAVRIARPEGVR